MTDVDRHLAFVQEHPEPRAGFGGHDDARVLLVLLVLPPHRAAPLHPHAQAGAAAVHQSGDCRAHGLNHGHLSGRQSRWGRTPFRHQIHATW